MPSTPDRAVATAALLGLTAVLALSTGLGCKRKSGQAETPRKVVETVVKTAAVEDGTTCDSSVHEGSELDAVYTFDFDCAVAYIQAAGCDFALDPDGNGTVVNSRTIEDMFNDPDGCMSGDACTGCTDTDSIDTVADCSTFAAFSYFTENGWSDMQAACPAADDGGEESGCALEGVFFEGEEMDCATWFFENMTCDTCEDIFDSRICEDAINDADVCQLGNTCTGCTDEDNRADGVDCDEIAAYSYFGQSASQALHTFVSGDDSCGEPQIVVDGVALTEEEAASILEVANNASLTQLDDDAGMDSRAAVNIVGQRPFATVYELGDVSYVGASAITQLKAYAELWVPEDDAPVAVTISTLAQEVIDNGEDSPYYDQLVTVSRAIITSEPYDTGKGLLFYVADPATGYEEDLKVYVTAGQGFDVSFASIFDDVALTGKFTLYYGSYEILLNDADFHSVALNTSGLAYENFETVQAAWHSTQSNPEGVVRVEADFGYTYMVPLPVFVDHPMWDGDDPGAPGDDGNEQDYNWNIAAQDALDDWRAQQ